MCTIDLINPVTCAIYVHEKRYSMESRPSKVLAREAAVESALKKLYIALVHALILQYIANDWIEFPISKSFW